MKECKRSCCDSVRIASVLAQTGIGSHFHSASTAPSNGGAVTGEPYSARCHRSFWCNQNKGPTIGVHTNHTNYYCRYFRGRPLDSGAVRLEQGEADGGVGKKSTQRNCTRSAKALCFEQMRHAQRRWHIRTAFACQWIASQLANEAHCQSQAALNTGPLVRCVLFAHHQCPQYH